MKDYNSLYNELSEAVSTFLLDRPAFLDEDITHTSLTFFNTGDVEKNPEVVKKTSAEFFLNHLVEKDKFDGVSYKRSRDGEGNPWIIFFTGTWCL